MDRIKELLLTVVFGGALLSLVHLFYLRTNGLFVVYTWIAMVTIFTMVNMVYTKLLVPIFNKLTPLEDGELKEAIHAFAKKVGYEVKSIRVMNASKRSKRLNAYFSGFGRFKKIVLFDTLIEKMSTEQIVSVLAHEIGHAKNKDVLWGMVSSYVVLAFYLVGLWFVLQSQALAASFGFDNIHFGFSLILFMVFMQPIGILESYLFNAYSRKREYRADRYAAHNGYATSLIESLKILSKENYGNLTPHPWYVVLHYSHPPVTNRITAIEKSIMTA